ncbi:MAG: serine protease [Motiliproteus sp.]
MSDTIDNVKGSIVGVGTYLPTRRPPAKLLGTGFVIADGKHVVTNNHVINVDLDVENRERLVVFAGQGAKLDMLTASLFRKDLQHDLAILSVSKKLPAMSLSGDGLVREGEVLAFTGFPIGAVLGLYPVTHRGMISSITPIAIPAPSSRQLDAIKIKRLRAPTMIYQLDATAYPGNSGSPLYHPETGVVVGVLNMVHVKTTKEDVLSKPSGISYAIPVKHLRALLQELETPKQ